MSWGGRGGPGPTVALALAVLGGVPLAPARAAPDATRLQELRKRWPSLDRAGRLDALLRVGATPSASLLAQAKTWLSDKDPVVRAQLVRVVANHVGVARHRAGAERTLLEYVQKHLHARRRLEQKEFEQVCRKHGRKLPPDQEMAAGADWKDPYDEKRRKLPPAIVEERAHMREVIASIEGTRSAKLYPALRQVFREHHDPAVLVRVVECFRKWAAWRSLPAMADLVRIQQLGREVGGAPVIGKREWETLRLKWDVHKDRLWWSRPEYVPRTIRPICEAATAITGARIGSAAELDAWLLANDAALNAHGVRLTKAFRRRAQTSQR